MAARTTSAPNVQPGALATTGVVTRMPVTPRDVRIERAQARLEALTDESLNTANPLVAEEAAQWATILIALRAA